MVNLASYYEDGTGVTKSADKAVELYQRAADLCNVDAIVNLALCYKNGTGVTKSDEIAVELYERAIELGDAGAVFSLALCYEDRRGRGEEHGESGRAVRTRN
jgi:TPR repeat protein